MAQHKNYINGRWLESSSKRRFKSINPLNGKTVCTVPLSSKKDVDEAVRSAQKAYRKWRLVPAPKRAEYLLKTVQLIEKNKEKLGTFLTREMGKVKQEALGDVQEAIDIGYYFAGEGRRMHGQTFHSELENKDIRSVRVPIGVFGLVTPWNFPIAIPSWKLFPCILAGNTCVLKPSRYTPGCATELIKLFDEAGILPGVVNLVHGTGEEAGNALVSHKGCNAISFTGSLAVGKKVGEICGGLTKPHCLEMGSKNPIIVMDDANIELAVDGAVWAGFGTTGQRCTAGSRVIIHKKVYDKFEKMFLRRVKKLKLGDGLKKSTQVGPLINEDALRKVERYVEIAKKEDKVKILCGGRKVLKGELKKGYFFEPTILTGVKRHHRVAREEIFGPVVALIKVNDLKEAIDVANDIEYGLSAAIFTESNRNAHIASRDLEFGIVYVNTATIGAEISSPFGGMKGTGNGHREAGGMGGALDTYTEIKVINVDYSGSIQKAQGISWE